MNLGTLFVRLNADSKDLLTGFAKGTAAVEKFAKETKKLANDVSQVSGTMLALGAGAMALAATVDSKTAKSMDNLKKSTALLAVQVADILMPAVHSLTEGFKNAADWVAGLDPHVKKQIGTWATWIAGIAVASKALAVVAGLVSGVAGALSSAAGVIAAIGAGPVLLLVGALAVAAAGVAALHYAFRTNLGGIADVWKTVVDWVSKTGAAAFEGLIKYATTFADHFLGQLRDMADSLSKFFDLMGASGARDKAHAVFQGLEEARQGLLKGGLRGVVSEALNLGKAAGTAFVDEWKRILKDMGLPDFKSLMNGGTARQPSGAARAQGDVSGMGFAADESMRIAEMRAGYAARTAAEAEFAKANFANQTALERAHKEELKARNDLHNGLVRQAQLMDGRLAGNRMTTGEARQYGTRKQEKEAARAAMTPQEQAKDDSAEAAAKWSAVGSIALKGITSAMGEVGTLVNAAAEAIQGGGGIWGAIIAVIMEVVKKTESAMKFVGVAMEFVSQIAALVEPLVAPIFDALTDILGTIMAEIGPVFEMLKPFSEAFVDALENLEPVFSAIGDLLAALEPIISFIGELIGAIDQALAPLLELLAGIIKVIATVILGIVIALNEIAAAFGDTKARAESAKLKALVDKMWAPGAEAKNRAEHDAAAATLRNASAQDEAAEAAKKVAEAFTNVPSGYKIALARMNAMGPGDSLYGSQSGMWAPDSPAGGTAAAAAASEVSAEQAAEIARLAEAAAYNAYADAIAAGQGYTAAIAAQDAARQAYLDANSGKGSGGSQKSGAPGVKTAAGSSTSTPTGMGSGFVVMGDVNVYTQASNVQDLLTDIEKAAQQKKGQETGNPFDP